MREFVIITLYLWLIFALFEIYKSALAAQYHISIVAKGFAIINAFALAKIAVIARGLKLDRRFRRTGKPADLRNVAERCSIFRAAGLLPDSGGGDYRKISRKVGCGEHS